MPVKASRRSSLFEETPKDCTCGTPGYCPAHGDYTPAVTDPEIVTAFAEACREGRPAPRVIRKELPN